MNLIAFVRKRSWFILMWAYIPGIFSNKMCGKSLRIIGVPAEIRTGHLPKKSRNSYRLEPIFWARNTATNNIADECYILCSLIITLTSKCQRRRGKIWGHTHKMAETCFDACMYAAMLANIGRNIFYIYTVDHPDLVYIHWVLKVQMSVHFWTFPLM
jgi:hypothetical protein